MEIKFVEARYKGKIELNDKQIDKLPNQIGLCSSVQFVESLKNISKQLSKKDKKVSLIETNNGFYKGQILGCSIIKNKNFDAILYIGDGRFHPIQMKSEFNKKVFAYNPFSKVLNEVTGVEKYFKREKGMLIKFLNSKQIGIILSTKPGQRFGDYKKLIRKYPKKKFYKFISDNINFNQLQNFNFIEIWVNTACPRIGLEDSFENKLKIINIEKILS